MRPSLSMNRERVEGSGPFRVSFQVAENRGPPHPCPLPKERVSLRVAARFRLFMGAMRELVRGVARIGSGALPMNRRSVEGCWPFLASFQVVENRGPPHPG